jgi:hypothetical protein
MKNEHRDPSDYPKDVLPSDRCYLKDVLSLGDAVMSVALDPLQSASVPIVPTLKPGPRPPAPMLEASTTEDHAAMPELGLDVYVDDWLFDEATETLNIVFTREASNFDMVGFGRLTFFGVRDYAYEWVDDSEPEEDGGWKDVLPESFVDLVTPDQGTDGRFYLLTNSREVSFKGEGAPVWTYIH